MHLKTRLPRLDRQVNHPRTRELAARACFDCHSNRTRWPWYAHVAPASWLLQSHVDEGRRELNFSRWDLAQEEADEAGDTVRSGEMPPWTYLLTHPEARLSDAEKGQLALGLDRTTRRPGESHAGEEGDETDREHD